MKFYDLGFFSVCLSGIPDLVIFRPKIAEMSQFSFFPTQLYDIIWPQTFRKSLKQGHMSSKMASKAHEGPISLTLSHFRNESKGIKRPKCQKRFKVPTSKKAKSRKGSKEVKGQKVQGQKS